MLPKACSDCSSGLFLSCSLPKSIWKQGVALKFPYLTNTENWCSITETFLLCPLLPSKLPLFSNLLYSSKHNTFVDFIHRVQLIYFFRILFQSYFIECLFHETKILCTFYFFFLLQHSMSLITGFDWGLSGAKSPLFYSVRNQESNTEGMVTDRHNSLPWTESQKVWI